MKKLISVLVISAGVFAAAALAQTAQTAQTAQAPQGGGQRGPAAPGGAPAAGGQRGGAPRGGRGTPEPPASGPIADVVNKFVEAVNKQDAAAMQKLVTADAVLVDEDGHFDPINMWIRFLTTTGPKTLTVLGGRGLSPLKVSETGDTAWAAFNYNLKETVTPRGQTTSTPNEINGTVTMSFKKNGGEWQAYLVHIAVMGKAFNPPPR